MLWSARAVVTTWTSKRSRRSSHGRSSPMFAWWPRRTMTRAGRSLVLPLPTQPHRVVRVRRHGPEDDRRDGEREHRDGRGETGRSRSA